MSAWSRSDKALSRTFTFATFPDAIAFATRLGFYAESVDHHPDILISYKKVTVTWSTHSAGGVTDKDFAGAEQSDGVAKGMGGQ
jgi:4a-hydroxytetrahydrobiopterin dehydratase